MNTITNSLAETNGGTIRTSSNRLRVLPGRFLRFQHADLPKEVEDRMEKEIEENIKSSQDSRIGKDKPTKRAEIDAMRKRITKRYVDYEYDYRRSQEIVDLSSSILNILGTRGVSYERDAGLHEKATLDFIHHTSSRYFPELDSSSVFFLGKRQDGDSVDALTVQGPNAYFEITHYSLVCLYGYPFFTSLEDLQDGASGAIALKENLIDVNINFFAGFLGGDRRFQHDVIYYVPERKFYFFDPFSQRYFPTTEEKLVLGIHMAIQRVCWGLDADQARFVIAQFKSKDLVTKILDNAKALLASGGEYFEGPNAKSRVIQEDVENEVSGSVRCFIENWVEVDDSSVLTVAECFSALKVDADSKGIVLPSPVESRAKIQELVRQMHGRSLRNDLRNAHGTATRCWKGLRLRSKLNQTLDASGGSLADKCPSVSAIPESPKRMIIREGEVMLQPGIEPVRDSAESEFSAESKEVKPHGQSLALCS